MLIPLSVAGLAISSTADAGVITISLAAEDYSDPTASEIITKLVASDSLIDFQLLGCTICNLGKCKFHLNANIRATIYTTTAATS